MFSLVLPARVFLISHFFLPVCAMCNRTKLCFHRLASKYLKAPQLLEDPSYFHEEHLVLHNDTRDPYSQGILLWVSVDMYIQWSLSIISFKVNQFL